MKFIETLNHNAVEYQDKVLLCDDANPKGLTYGQIDTIAGKVYGYLQDKGIGKEDFVMICLPRGIQPLISMFGVWKNGSAFVLVEDNYAPERIEFIRKDCGCKLVINAEVWAEIQQHEYKAGFEPTEDHDAAFAVYTSGTTGNPKGVLHEYGNLDRMVTSITMPGKPLAEPDDRFALVAPLNFVASLLITLYSFYFAVRMYVVAYSVIKNPLQIGMYLIKNKITGTFLTPSFIRKMKSAPPGLKFCIIGSEPANRVYLEGLDIHNFYLMSESGFAVSHFLIDKMYEQTPVGTSVFGHPISLLDENGNEVADGEEGEICFENKFVRGYINLPDETANAFRDHIYHSGDLAKRDENGNLVICGRLSDMVKINGNRVEPAEIEEVTKKVLNINWAAARIFDNGDRVFICAYYLDNLKVDFEKTRKEMEQYLPYYMLPSYFIHIDEVPLKATGKMDRKALPAPVIDDYQDDYVAPRDEVEKALCEAFKKALKLNNVGIHDDFYQLGGDSMSSMDVLVESKLPGLSATDIFRGHTPEKIAEIYKATHLDPNGKSDEEANEEAMKVPHKLTAEQMYMVDYQFYTPLSTMYNLFSMLKFDASAIDMDLLAESIGKAVKAHPALLTTFSFNKDGEMEQSYHPELFTPVVPEKVTAAELEEIKKTLVQPFKIVNSKLFRCRLFITEEAGYLFLDVHHTLFDGTSSKVFLGDILKAYAGMDLPTDYYYLIMQRREQDIDSALYEESRQYFEKTYGGIKWHTRPKTDNQTRENTDEEMFYDLPTTLEEIGKVSSAHGQTPNSFFITAALLATAYYNKKDRTMVSWIYNGRNDLTEMTTVGLLFRNLPVGVVFRKEMTLRDLYESVLTQINKGMEHSIYPYVELSADCVTGDLECVLYQDTLREVDDVPGLMGEVEIPHNNAASQNILDLEILNTPEGLEMMFDYASSRYEEKSMERYRDAIGAAVRVLIENNEKADKLTVQSILRQISKKLHEGGFMSQNWFMTWMQK